MSDEQVQNNETGSPVSTDEQAAPTQEPVRHGEQTRPIFVTPEMAKGHSNIKIELANESYNDTADKLNGMANVDWTKSESGRKFLGSFQQSMFSIPFQSFYADITYRDGSFWAQEINSEMGKLAPAVQRYTGGDGVKLTGEAAMMAMRQALGMGTTFTVPLYHTGIWVTMKAPSDDELVELERRLTEEKADLGRQTHGLIFGNNSAIFAGILADFAIGHILDSNVIENDRSYHQLIKCLDLPVLVWALAYTCWPNGFKYSRVKLNPADSSYVTEEAVLKLGGCLITDQLALTDRQRAHMAKQRGQKVNAETLKIYQGQFLRGQPRSVVVNDALSFEVGVPSIAEYLESGNKWVTGITTMVDLALGTTANQQTRFDYIDTHGKATNLRQFSHWVRSITIGKDIIENREDIDNNLDIYSGADQYNEQFFEAIQKYVEDSTVSVIAVTRGDYDSDSVVMKQFPDYLVLDVFSTFFILLLQRVQNLADRT